MSAPVLDDPAPAGRDAVVRLEGIVTRFGRNVVHEGLDLSIHAGEIVALVGGSGSGKTTLLRHVIGLTRPAAGGVEVFGEALDAGGAAERLARQRRMGVLFQHGALFSAFSVAQNIAFPLRELGVMSRQEIDALAAMGVSRSLRLVLPKVVALTLAMPLLVLWTSAIALFGGWVSAWVELDIGLHFFLQALPDAVPVANLYIGLAKGAVFGFLIALVACHFGLRVQPDTESLSTHTTASVVAAITVVILVDAVFAIATRSIGLPL